MHKITELEGIEHEKVQVGEGIAYTHTSKTVKKPLEEYLRFIDSLHCQIEEVLAWRVDPGGDLFNCLKAKIYEEEAYPAFIPAMVGTITKASIGYFLSEKGIFHVNTLITPTGLELVSGSGTVGLEEGRVTPHIHIVVADHTGNAYGGHLFPGTIVKEYVEGFLLKVKGVRFERIWNKRIKAYPLHFIKIDERPNDSYREYIIEDGS
ncbi:MAG: hypothetical protein DRP27_09760 [Thermotogae bacterium]|nr:MAG: hypothetical protein DRP27_09760 [Thermotogota bacterium]